jgi:hypothetical protein
MAQLKKPVDMSGSDVDEDVPPSGDDDIPVSELSTSGSDSEYSPTDAEFEATAGADTVSASAEAAAAAAPSQSTYLGLEDPQLNIYLQ